MTKYLFLILLSACELKRTQSENLPYLPEDGAAITSQDSGSSVTEDVDASTNPMNSCLATTYICTYYSAYPPGDKTATKRDLDSFRMMTGYICIKTPNTYEWVTTEVCDYTKTCDSTKPTQLCTSCGRFANRVSYWTDDNVIKQDTVGCSPATGWGITCMSNGISTYGYDTPYWLDVRWQNNLDNLPRMVVTKTGHVYLTGGKAPYPGAVTLAINKMDVVPGGEVDLDIVVNYLYVDNFSKTHQWYLHGHVITNCN